MSDYGPTSDFKVLRREDGHLVSCHSGWGRWTPGRDRSVRGKVEACERGLHYCRGEQVLGWLHEVICPFTVTGDQDIDAGGKRVTNRGHIGKPIETWNERTARLFAVDCARIAVNRYAQDDQRELLHACLDVTTACAEYGQEWSVAWSAARSAAWSVAWSVAGSAAGSAARLAAESAAWSVAWSVAGSAAGSAARLAAESAAWSVARLAAESAAWLEQFTLLCRYLNGEEGPFVEASDD